MKETVVSDVQINRCNLRIVRHGGWSWGAAPDKLLQSAIKILPELIARELGEFWIEEYDYEITAPLSISIPIHLNELHALSDAGPSLYDNGLTHSSEFTVVGQRINSAVRAALLDKYPLPEVPSQSETTLTPLKESEPARSSLRSSVIEVLCLWQRRGMLSQRLSIFSPVALEAWHENIVETCDRSGAQENEQIVAIELLIEEVLRLMPVTLEDREAVLRRRLIVITEVIAGFNLTRCPAAVLSKLDQIIPLKPDVTEETMDRDSRIDRESDGAPGAVASKSNLVLARDRIEQTLINPEPSFLQSKSTTDAHRPRRATASISDLKNVEQYQDASVLDETESAVSLPKADINVSGQPTTSQRINGPDSQPSLVRPSLRRIANKVRREASALPFLLLSPLSSIGYLKTLAAVLEASKNTDAAPLFATALAYKILAPPARGWRRDSATISSASVFAGLETPTPEPVLVQLSGTLSEHLAPLDSTLTGSLIAGHNREATLLLLSLREEGIGGFLLFEAEGLFPIQWATQLSDLRLTLMQLESSIIFIPRESADVDLLRWLSDEGFRFVTDAPPTRGESLRSIRGPDVRWWTNDQIVPGPAFAQMASALPSAVEDSLALLQVLAKDRPAIPLANDSALDRHLTMAAAVALGTIAWDLWKDREMTAPHIALERFSDLQAHVEYANDRVTVSLPLGKRFLDLRDHALLADVDDVPWFNGRKLTFSSS